MLKIGFIFPSSEYLYDPFKGDPHTHFQILTILKTYFGNKVYLSLIDLGRIKKEFAIYHIPECDVYLHSVYTLDYNEEASIVKNLRERYPKTKHIAGGPHATVFQEECRKAVDKMDPFEVWGTPDVTRDVLYSDAICNGNCYDG